MSIRLSDKELSYELERLHKNRREYEARVEEQKIQLNSMLDLLIGTIERIREIDQEVERRKT